MCVVVLLKFRFLNHRHTVKWNNGRGFSNHLCQLITFVSFRWNCCTVSN